MLFLLAAIPALHAADPVTALAYSPDGKLLAAGAYDEIVLRDASTGKIARRIAGVAGKARALAFSPDGTTLAFAGGVAGRSGSVALIDLAGGKATILQSAADEMLTAAYSPDGKLLATGGADGIVRIFALGSAAAPREIKGHTGWITAVAFSPDGKLFASASADQTVHIVNPSTWEQIFELPTTIAGPVTALAFALESDILAFTVNGTEERSIRLWRTQGAFTEIDPARPNMRAGLMQTRPYDQGACVPLALAFHKAPQHSRMIEGCTDNTVRFVGQGGNTIATGAGHTEWVYAVAASPDGSHLASGSGDGAIRIWNPAGKLLATWAPEEAVKP